MLAVDPNLAPPFPTSNPDPIGAMDDDFQEPADVAHYNPNDYSIDHGDDDEEHNAITTSPGTAASPTNIAIDLTPAGLNSFLMDDLDEIMSHERCICSDCWCCFTRPQDLNRHRNAKHTHEVNHRCPFPGCSGRFARLDVLRRHLSNVHQRS
ncbi:hypothetical protein [Absidia glauca]|uniref:C2H2-type domain-containing protein n=1 Tax=Absidia glauca TaxID=4829 RepID=A0A163M608_ABSGL|nr:hypothetical protein [Absidia glauca]